MVAGANGVDPKRIWFQVDTPISRYGNASINVSGGLVGVSEMYESKSVIFAPKCLYVRM